MGNGQSAPGARRRAQNKLSKPRTNTTGNLLTSKGPAISSRQNTRSSNPFSADPKLYNDVSKETAGEGTDGTRWKRMSLFRSKSIQEQGEGPEIDAGTEAEVIERPLDSRTRRHSSANSVTFHHSVDDLHYNPPPNPHMPSQYMPHLQHHPRLSLVAEVQLIPAEKVEPLKRASLYSQEENSQLSSTPLPRTTSDSTLYGPIRRRSLQQPGVATRRSYIGDDFDQSLPSQFKNTRNDSRQSLPSQLKGAEQLQGYYYQSGSATSSPILSREVPGQQADFFDPGPRVQTPTDLDYGHIGAFKLGSLRITNGEASPDVSDGGLPGPEEDYLTMGKSRRGASRQLGVGQASKTLFPPGDNSKPAWGVRAESPLRQSFGGGRKPLVIETQLTSLDPSLGLFDFNNKYLEGGSAEAANDYTQELTLSPFSFVDSPTASPQLQATSKHTAVEDDLFEPESISPAQDAPQSIPRSFDSGYGGVNDVRKGSAPQDAAPKSLAKADSGYSSIISLRSLKREAGPAVPPKDVRMTPARSSMPMMPTSTGSTSSAPEVSMPSQHSLAGIHLQPRTAVKLPENSFAAHPSTSIQGFPVNTPKLPHHRLETRTHIGMLGNNFRQSLPATLNTSNDQPQYHGGSSSSNVSAADTMAQRRGNKIQKPRPQSMATSGGSGFTVRAIKSSSGRLSLPSISNEADRMPAEQSTGFPAANLPNTTTNIFDLRRARSKDTLGTILSVGSAEIQDEISVARLHDKLHPVHRTIPEYSTSVPESRSLPFWKSLGSRRKSTHAKPIATPSRVDEDQSKFEDHVTSVQTAAASLGNSPYDIPASFKTLPSSSATNVRAKSMTSQLDADAAARFQRARSSSKEAQVHSVLRSRKSYDSALVGNCQSRASTKSLGHWRGYPPQSHANRSAWNIPSPAPLDNPPTQSSPDQGSHKAQTSGVSALSQQTRQKPPPPVSMQTQRQLNHNPVNSSMATPPSRKAPTPPTPDHAPPHTSSRSSPDHKEVSDPWAKQKDFWAERRKSAEIVLRTKKSMETVRAKTAVPSFSSENELRFSDGMDIRRSESAGPRTGAQSFQHGVVGRYGGTNQAPKQAWIGHSTGHHRSQWQEQAFSEAYHHTYGSSLALAQGHHRPGLEEDYFPADDQDYYSQVPQDIHARNSSTGEMLGLDIYTGPLSHEYHPGYDLAGNPGILNVGNLGSGYGVDLSHTRNFLQSVN